MKTTKCKFVQVNPLQNNLERQKLLENIKGQVKNASNQHFLNFFNNAFYPIIGIVHLLNDILTLYQTTKFWT